MRRFVGHKIGDRVYTYEMSVTESIKWSIYEWIVIFAVFALFYSIIMLVVPFLLVFAYFNIASHQRKWVNIVGIIVTILFTCDYHYSWIMEWVFSALKLDSFFKTVMGVNLGLGVAHLLILVIGDKLMDDTYRTEKYVRKVMILFFSLGMFGILAKGIIVPYQKSETYLKEQQTKFDEEKKEQNELDRRLKKFNSDEEGF